MPNSMGVQVGWIQKTGKTENGLKKWEKTGDEIEKAGEECEKYCNEKAGDLCRKWESGSHAQKREPPAKSGRFGMYVTL